MGGEPCPHCGFLPQRPPRDVLVADGELGLVTGRRANGNVYDPETRQRWLGMFAHIANERGYKPGWVAFKFKEKFGAFPDWGSTPDADSAHARGQELGALAHDRVRPQSRIHDVAQAQRTKLDRRPVCSAADLRCWNRRPAGR